MKPTQKVIKYFAMAAAIGLMVAILSGIVTVITSISDGADFFSGDVEYKDYVEEYNKVENLNVTNRSTQVYIKTGEVTKVTVEATHVPDTTVIELRNGTLTIEDKAYADWFINIFNWGYRRDRDGEITITLPKDYKADHVELKLGSGKSEIVDLTAHNLEIDGGSGRITGKNITADKADFNFGSGAVELSNVYAAEGGLRGGSGHIGILDSKVNDMDFHIGSGNFRYSGILTGRTDVKGGSGSIVMDIIGNEGDFQLDFENGSGGIWLNGDKVNDYKDHGKSAQNELTVDGGSGRVTVSFE